jgi:hypothetical protein
MTILKQGTYTHLKYPYSLATQQEQGRCTRYFTASKVPLSMIILKQGTFKH